MLWFTGKLGGYVDVIADAKRDWTLPRWIHCIELCVGRWKDFALGVTVLGFASLKLQHFDLTEAERVFKKDNHY